jgi:basic membrane lipoprotein Med (substrate-binding protein (PBP1-ABC) superfamily)
MKRTVWVLLTLSLILSACGAPATETPVSSTQAATATESPVVTEVPAATQSPADKPFRVAVVMASVTTDQAFGQSMYDALFRVQEEMGSDKFEFVYTENVPVVRDAVSAIRDYAAQGFDLIIAHGSQYGSSLPGIASEFPNTSFAWGTAADTFGQPNIFAYQAASQEGGYVNGVVAASLSKTGVIGVVGPGESGDGRLYVEGFKSGVFAVNPEALVNVGGTDSFSNPSLSADAAVAQVAAGADVLTGSSRMLTGAIGMAEESGVLWFGNQCNQNLLAPKVVVASQTYHWEVVLRQIVGLIQGGTRGGKLFIANLKNGGEVVEFNPGYSLPDGVQTLADKTIQDIIDGTITITLP